MKRLILLILLAAGIAGISFSLEAGGGISVFVPESLYLHQQGSISVETNLQYTLGLSKFVSFPIGVSYNKIDGYTPTGSAALDAVSAPWFFGDSIMGYVMAKLHLPVSIFYLNLSGGAAGNWNVTLTPVGQSIENYLAGSATGAAITGLSAKAPLGYGWVAGASLGVTIKKFSVDLSATYRSIRSPLELTGSYYTVTGSGTTPSASPAQSIALPSGAALLMQGVSIGINGHMSL